MKINGLGNLIRSGGAKKTTKASGKGKTAAAGSASSASAAGATSGSSSVEVSLSETAQTLGEAVSVAKAQPEVRVDVVDAVKDALKGGRKVPPAQVAAKVADEELELQRLFDPPEPASAVRAYQEE